MPYSILGAREVPAGMKTLRMVLLRNDFGIGEWRGRWGRKSSTWQESVVAGEVLDFESTFHNGSFWMSFSDFVKLFKVIYACRKSMPVQGCNECKFIEMKRGLGMTSA